jgi:hypothetical protein
MRTLLTKIPIKCWKEVYFRDTKYSTVGEAPALTTAPPWLHFVQR